MSAGRRIALLATGTLLLLELSLGSQHPLTTCGLIALVAALVLNLMYKPRKLWTGIIAGAGLAWGTYLLHWNVWLAALLPALFQALLALLVARTLRPGQTPAIQRIGMAMQPDGAALPTEVIAYARHSTWLWLIIFCVLSLFNLAMVLRSWPSFRPPVALGLLDALVAACVVLLEFFYRRWRYEAHGTHTLPEFWRELRRLDPVKILLP